MDPEVLTGEYRRYVAMVRGRAERILGCAAAAQDVAQECFIRLMGFRQKGGTDLNTAGFLYRTVTNLALNRLRDARTHRTALEGIAKDTVPDAPAAEDTIALRQILALSGEEEAVIAAYYFLDGLEHEEIAELLGIPRRTVGRRLDRFRLQARAYLEDKENGHA